LLAKLRRGKIEKVKSEHFLTVPAALLQVIDNVHASRDFLRLLARLEIHGLPGYVSLPELQPQPITLVAEAATLGYLDLSSEIGWLRVAMPEGAQVLGKTKGLSAESS